jgi:hypothetical protein
MDGGERAKSVGTSIHTVRYIQYSMMNFAGERRRETAKQGRPAGADRWYRTSFISGWALTLSARGGGGGEVGQAKQVLLRRGGLLPSTTAFPCSFDYGHNHRDNPWIPT